MSIRNSKVWLLTFIMIWAWSTTSLHAASVPGSSTSCHCWASYWGNSANSSAFSLLGGFQTGGFPNPLVICGWTGQSLFQWPSFSQYAQWFGSNCPLPVSPAAPTPLPPHTRPIIFTPLPLDIGVHPSTTANILTSSLFLHSFSFFSVSDLLSYTCAARDSIVCRFFPPAMPEHALESIYESLELPVEQIHS